MDVAGSVERFLQQRRTRTSLASELGEYAAWLPLALLARSCALHRLSFLFTTWAVLGWLTACFARQRVLELAWWHAVLAAAALSLLFRSQLAQPGNEGFLFFARYTLLASLATAALGSLVPASVAAALPAVLARLRLVRAGTAEPGAVAGAPRAN